DDRPSVVDAGIDAIHLVVTAVLLQRRISARSMLGGEEPAARIPGEALRIAVPVGPDRRTGDRVVHRNRAVPLQTQDLAVERTEVLRQRVVSGIADADVELAVGTDANPSAVVDVATGEAVQKDLVDDALAVLLSQSDEPILQAAVGGGVREVDVGESVRGKAGVECEAEQPALVVRTRHDGEGRPRRRIEDAILDHTDASVTLGDEETSVGGEIDGPWRDQAASHGVDALDDRGRRTDRRGWRSGWPSCGRSGCGRGRWTEGRVRRAGARSDSQ